MHAGVADPARKLGAATTIANHNRPAGSPALTTDTSSHTGTSIGLRARLKLETRDLHRRAERTGIMRTLLLGRLDRPAYCLLLRNLHEIYAGLEMALESHFSHPLLAPIVFRSLFRLGHIESDLRHLHGGGWEHELAVRPAAAAYRERLIALASARPELLVAHAYVRYLVDLSEGQIVGQLVTEQLRLGDEGTRFYQFGSTEDVDLLVAHFRTGLDAIPATPIEAEAIVEEAQDAFRRHIELFEQLAPNA